MKRRGFLFVWLFFVGGLLTVKASPLALINLKKRFLTYKKPKLDENSLTGTLSDAEMRTILALVEVAAPRTKMQSVDHEFFQRHVNNKTSNVKGYLKEYREGAKLLDETTHKVIDHRQDFVALSVAERNTVLEAILWKYRAGAILKPRVELLLASRTALSFREFVLKDLLAAFYRSGMGWALVGYIHYPGTPAADPFDYAKPNVDLLS